MEENKKNARYILFLSFVQTFSGNASNIMAGGGHVRLQSYKVKIMWNEAIVA
jgi:hypothetical protein